MGQAQGPDLEARAPGGPRELAVHLQEKLLSPEGVEQPLLSWLAGFMSWLCSQCRFTLHKPLNRTLANHKPGLGNGQQCHLAPAPGTKSGCTTVSSRHMTAQRKPGP